MKKVETNKHFETLCDPDALCMQESIIKADLTILTKIISERGQRVFVTQWANGLYHTSLHQATHLLKLEKLSRNLYIFCAHVTRKYLEEPLSSVELLQICPVKM